MKKTDGRGSTIVIGFLICAVLFLAKATGCIAQEHINHPIGISNKFNEKVTSLFSNASLERVDTSSNAIVYNYVLNQQSAKVIYYHASYIVNKIAFKGSKELVLKLFNNFNQDANKKFVILGDERIYIEKQTEATWALFITKK